MGFLAKRIEPKIDNGLHELIGYEQSESTDGMIKVNFNAFVKKGYGLGFGVVFHD